MAKHKYVRTIEKATSVKRIDIIGEPTPQKFGRADFTYLPVFSVFDYGTIKPTIPLDNSTICLMAGYNFELLLDEKISSHMLGMIDRHQKVMTAREAIENKIPIRTMRVRFVNRVMPEFREGEWDYSTFENPEVNNYVVPLEFMTRNGLGASSSVWKRVKSGSISMGDLGLPDDFKPGDKIQQELIPILDYSTKFEPEDRYVSGTLAQQLVGLSDERWQAVQEIQRKASQVMTDYAASRGFTRVDGKVEFVSLDYGNGPRDILGDAVCTWHEDRLLTPQGIGISKQRIRDEMVHYNPEWKAEIDRAKKQAREEGHKDFRTLMAPSIGYRLPPSEFFDAVNKLFQAGTNQWVGHQVYDVFKDKDDSLEDQLERAVELFQNTQLAKRK